MARSWFARWRLLWWSLVALGVAALDYVTGPFVQFPILFVIPVGLAAWFNGFLAGVIFALVLKALRLWFALALWTVSASVGEALVNTLIDTTVLVAFAFFIHRTAEHNRALARRVRTLEDLLPICSFCKKIRDDGGTWHALEAYISAHSETRFTHGLCPDCARQHFGPFVPEGPS